MRTPSPVVYLGPSLEAERARELLPNAVIRPPVRRGDLYRDRSISSGPLVIIDGVFQQEYSVSPREIVDILRDGAVVVGASSLGAMRAAECSPAGMLGVGAIFRLFRRGCLQSDDEVAVTFDAQGKRASVPLVNVRYAARALLRKRCLEPAGARRLVEVAERLHYAERYWQTIVAGARLAPGLASELATFDLKRRDAVRCLERVRALPPARKSSSTGNRELLERALTPREARFEAPERRGTPEEQATFVHFWLASGGLGRLAADRRKALLSELGLTQRKSRDQLAELDDALTRHERAPRLVAAAVLGALEGAGLERESLRWAATRTGAASAAGVPGTAQKIEAELALAAEYGCESYLELQARAGAASTRRALASTRDLLAAAIVARDASFAAPDDAAHGAVPRPKPLRSR